MKPLDISDIRHEIPYKIHKGVSMDSIKELLDYGDEIDFDVYLPTKGKNLQRDFCWTLLQKQQLIVSVLKGIELPSISVIVYKEETGLSKITYKIIDGKQRLSTLISFYKNEFPITHDGNHYYYNDLSTAAKYEISTLSLRNDRIYMYKNQPETHLSDDTIIKWFEMINFSGTPQDEEHLKNLKS